MGYHVNQRDNVFVIAKENFAHALEAIKALAGCEDEMGGGIPGRKHFSFVDMDFVNAKSIHQAMQNWGWDVETDVDGDINSIQFNGDKMGDEIILFKAIAPWVRDESYIEMGGENGDIWRWYFEEGELKEQKPLMVWK